MSECQQAAQPEPLAPRRPAAGPASSAVPDARHRVYDRLVHAAAAGQTVAYREVAALAGLDVDQPAGRDALGALLRTISTTEHAGGRPLLSAVVVHRANRRPGRGFFALARDLGLYPDRGDDSAQFFQDELARVHAFWRPSPPGIIHP